MKTVEMTLALAAAGLALAASARAQGYFTEVTEEVGLRFQHDPGDEGQYWLPEIMAAGGGFLDFDGDGDLDVYVVQSGSLPEAEKPRHPPNRLYRHDPGGKLVDVTETSGLGDRGYGTGMAVGDVDNDGLVDVYVTNYGADALYRNRGGGKFENVTGSAGITGDAWSASAVFCDYDADGFLDLYVSHYVKYTATKACVAADGSPDYCSPQSFDYEKDTLYHNDGDGTFTDVSETAGIAEVAAPGLGVLCFDFTGDGKLDFYVANDGEANHLWTNQGNGTFVDEAFLMGAALTGMGRAGASMGVVVGDVDGDADFDLFMTHLQNQTNTLYVNDGRWGFEDESAARGLGATSLPFTGFGTAFIDFDHDGDLDLAVVNGRVRKLPPLPKASLGPYWNFYAEPNLLFANDGTGRFEDASSRAGAFTAHIEVSRGLALGDFDEDGDLDLLETNTAGPARLYRNDAAKSGSFLLVRALDAAHRRDAHGAVVTVTAGGERYARVADPGFSYLSANDPRAHFGLPTGASVDGIEVRWPDGSKERFPGGPANRVVVVAKGKGTKVP